MFQLSDPSLSSIIRLAAFLEDTSDPWWILGSAAVALSGVNPGGVRDIDVLVSLQDARRLMETKALPNEVDGGGALFRSEIFLRPEIGDVPVEIMANYVIREEGGWWPVKLQTREAVSVCGTTVYVPELGEQAMLLQRLGRPKDLRRLACLRAHNPKG